VAVGDRRVAAIGTGLLVLLGVAPDDTETGADRIAERFARCASSMTLTAG
jgi:D-Tyr-tRNAtyr deacylase